MVSIIYNITIVIFKVFSFSDEYAAAGRSGDTIDPGTQSVEETRSETTTVPVNGATDVQETVADQEPVGDNGMEPMETPIQEAVDEPIEEASISVAGETPAYPEEVVEDDSDQGCAEKVETGYIVAQAEESLQTPEIISSENGPVEELVSVVPGGTENASEEELNGKKPEEEKNDIPVEVKWAANVEQGSMSCSSFEIVTETIEVVRRSSNTQYETGDDDYRR